MNVLFVIIDQLRADCLFGPLAKAADLKTLRAFADEAVSFRYHHTVTCPCGPSRASILTGQYAMNHRAVRNGTPLRHDLPNIATEARKAGYAPLLYGYTDVTADPRLHDPNDPRLHTYEEVLAGFDEAVEMRLEESWPWRAHLAAKGHAVPPYPEIFRPDGDRPDAPAFYAAEDSDTAFLTDRVIKELRVRPPGWFAHVTYIRPHPPLVAPAPYNDCVDRGVVPPAHRPVPRDAEASAHPFNAPTLQAKRIASNVVGFPDLPDDDETVRMLRALYLGLAREVDDHIGRLIAFLRETGQYDDTLIILTADHGEMLGDHHQWGKMTYRNAAYHVPLIVRDPRHTEAFGTSVEAMTESVDVTPTILDLIGQEVPDTMDGVSLRPFLEGVQPDGWRTHSFSELDFGDPVDPTLWQEALGLGADDANLAILRTRDRALVHFNGGLPPVLLERDNTGEERIAEADDKILLEMSQAMLNHRMRHAEGRFARTMITAEGVRRG
ncbi:sulfatase-like hydrolase/transferase [Roseovarius sp. SCSIO 43702]|nr:sulfatase-like hydrolase/transferase [Roseovarius sp. SCSIO 43702]